MLQMHRATTGNHKRYDEWYNGGMTLKTSVTLSEELVQALAAEVTRGTRSAFIEAAVWSHLRARRRAARDSEELARIAAHAEELNREAGDVIAYQDYR